MRVSTPGAIGKVRPGKAPARAIAVHVSRRQEAARLRISGSFRAMGEIKGSRSVEINAPLQRCFDIAADIQNAPEWQGSLKQVEVLESDSDGLATLVQTTSDAKVKTVTARLRFSYAQPKRIDWVQEKGDTKSLTGSWTFEDLGSNRTRATYGLVVDPGRMLGMLVRGPAESKVRDFLLGGAAEGLKRRAESG
jgi:uncharacterized membrane protein